MILCLRLYFSSKTERIRKTQGVKRPCGRKSSCECPCRPFVLLPQNFSGLSVAPLQHPNVNRHFFVRILKSSMAFRIRSVSANTHLAQRLISFDLFQFGSLCGAVLSLLYHTAIQNAITQMPLRCTKVKQHSTPNKTCQKTNLNRFGNGRVRKPRQLSQSYESTLRWSQNIL
jgi:hypothetical protein